jgi:hypothetical protein
MNVAGRYIYTRLPMPKLLWKTTLTLSVLAAATAYAFAQMPSSGPMGQHEPLMNQMHQQMMRGRSQSDHRMGMQGGIVHGGMHHEHGDTATVLSMPGQGAFGALQEVVQLLESDPKTDWSKVNIDALRQHLIDMNEVTLDAVATPTVLDNGIEFAVTGGGRTLEAIKRMVPVHVRELRESGWNASTAELPNGIKLTILATESQPLTKLKALGFMGIMVQGSHHQAHHLMIAMGQSPHL